MAPRWDDYRGGFDHPLRAFGLGMALIALLVLGFVLGTGLAGDDTVSVERVRIVTRVGKPRVRVVTRAEPVVRTVVRGRTRLVRLPGSVVYRIERVPASSGGVRTVFRVQTVRVPEPATSTPTRLARAATTFFAPEASTVTVTETATETVGRTLTQTETVTHTETAIRTTLP